MFRISGLKLLAISLISLGAGVAVPVVWAQAVDPATFMKMAAPNENHKKLDPLVGKWNLTVKFPGEADTKGQSEFKWVLGGRFLVENSITQEGGQPFEWIGWHGFDNQTKKHVSTWIDNFGTGIDVMSGTFDDAKKTLTYLGETEDFATGGKAAVKWIIRLETKDRFVTEMYEGSVGKEGTKVMEIIGTRG